MNELKNLAIKSVYDLNHLTLVYADKHVHLYRDSKQDGIPWLVVTRAGRNWFHHTRQPNEFEAWLKARKVPSRSIKRVLVMKSAFQTLLYG